MSYQARWLVTGLVLATMLGCANKEAPPQAYIQAIENLKIEAPSFNVGLTKPPVRIGDTFVFDNPPEQWVVVSVNQPFINWQSSTGDHMQTAWSTLLPPIRWGGDSSNNSSGSRHLSNITGSFFPLKKGNQVTFTEERISARPAITHIAQWRCLVGDQSNIQVPAGKSNVWEIICNINGQERILISYAENIGHYVRYAVETPNGLIIRQLTAYSRKKQAE